MLLFINILFTHVTRVLQSAESLRRGAKSEQGRVVDVVRRARRDEDFRSACADVIFASCVVLRSRGAEAAREGGEGVGGEEVVAVGVSDGAVLLVVRTVVVIEGVGICVDMVRVVREFHGLLGHGVGWREVWGLEVCGGGASQAVVCEGSTGDACSELV